MNVLAQDPEVDLEELLNGHAHKVDELLYSNLSFIQQTGSENQVASYQDQLGYQSNFIEVSQQNRGNNAYIKQSGQGHGTAVLQYGVANEANVWSEGHLTTTKVVQYGDGNVVNSYINNRNELTQGAYLEQRGNENIIEFALTGNNGYATEAMPKAAYIRQQGNNLEVKAAFDSYNNPIHIEQKSGPGGGMQVNISTSDFSFPMK